MSEAASEVPTAPPLDRNVPTLKCSHDDRLAAFLLAMTPDEREKLKKMKEKVAANKNGKEVDPEEVPYFGGSLDMECIRFLMVRKFDVKKAIERRLKFRGMWHKEGLHEADPKTVQEYLHTVDKWYYLSGRDTEGRLVCWMDAGLYFPEEFPDIKALMVAFFYSFEIILRDISACRNGVVWVSDVSDYGWKNFSLKIEKLGATMMDCSPVRMQGFWMLNPPMVMRAIMAVMKPFMSKKMKKRVKEGWDAPEGMNIEDIKKSLCWSYDIHVAENGLLYDAEAAAMDASEATPSGL